MSRPCFVKSPLVALDNYALLFIHGFGVCYPAQLTLNGKYPR